MHDTIIHNLMTLLECGAFGTIGGARHVAGEQPVLDAMSPHKWRILTMVAEELHVLPYVARGAEQLKGDSYLSSTLQRLLEAPERKLDVKDFDTSRAQLYNHWTSKRLEEVHEEEMNSPTLSEETLMLLDLIVANADEIITHDVSVEGIIALGFYLRNNHARIDFGKLTTWLKYVGLVRVAALEGSILMDSMHFAQEELPFVEKPIRKSGRLFMNSLTKAMKKHSCGFSTRMKVAMLETVSHRFVSAISLITDIEE